MSHGIDVAETERTLKFVGNVSYLLHTIVAVGAVIPGFQPSIALLIVAFVIDLAKRPEAVNTWQQSHFSWRIRTVLWAAGLYVITLPLWLIFVLPGIIAWCIISIWFFYRIVRGWVNLNANKSMDPIK